ncbi:MAG: PqqD family protein [Chlorobi bacterium]|nr:PqqD family protein [Chlorobiota bacterium]
MELKKNLAISDTGFVFDANSGESYSLNPIGLEILNYLKQGLKDDEIREKIMEKYDVDASTFDLVYFDFIRTLQQFDLFEKS